MIFTGLALKTAASSAWGFIRAIDWRIYAVTAVLLVATIGVYKAGQADVQEEFDAYKIVVIEATNKAREKAILAQKSLELLQERRAAEARMIELKYEKELADVKIENDKLVADIKSGNRKLRYYWSILQNGGKDLSTEELNAIANSQAESAGRAIRAAGEAEAQIKGLQAFLISEGYKTAPEEPKP